MEVLGIGKPYCLENNRTERTWEFNSPRFRQFKCSFKWGYLLNGLGTSPFKRNNTGSTPVNPTKILNHTDIQEYTKHINVFIHLTALSSSDLRT
jgi:hypothetical protein